MVKVTLEFTGVDEAIVALGKLVGGKAARAATKEVVPAAPTGTAVPPVPVVAATPAPSTPPTTRTRKGRADKGQPRGPYKTAAGTASGDQPTNAAVIPLASAVLAPAATDAAPAATGREAAATQAAPAAAPVKREDAQKKLEALFEAKQLEVTRAVLARFGVQRLRDLPDDQLGAFVQKADSVLAGGAA